MSTTLPPAPAPAPAPPGVPVLPADRVAPLDPPAGRYLSDHARRIADGVHALEPRIRELAEKAERDGRLDPEIIRALTDLGIYRAVAPTELGGLALGARDVAEIAMALGRGDAAVGWTFLVACSLRMVSSFTPELTSDLYSRLEGHAGPLAAGGSTFAAITGTAARVHGGWSVEGKWTYVSGNHDAAWLFGGVAWRDGGRSGHGLIMMDPADLTRLDDWHVSGMSASDSNSVVTTAPIVVPDAHFVDMADLPIHMDSVSQRYSGLAYQTRARSSMMSVAVLNIAILVGMAEGAFEIFADLAQTRRPFSPPYPSVAEMASAQVAAGKAQAMIALAKATLVQYADEVDHLATIGEDYTAAEEAQGSMNLAYAGHLCQDAINLLVRILGSSVMTLSNPLQRYSRDAQVILSHGALRMESLAEITGRRLLGRPPFDMFAAGLQNKITTK